MKLTKASYKVRILGCMVLVELLVLAIFNFWPKPDPNNTDQDLRFSENETVFEDIQITRQGGVPPPPPSPQVPVEVPNDEVIEEEIVFDDVNFSEYADSLSLGEIGKAGSADEIAASPEQLPQLVKIVESNTTDAAKKANLRARVWVNFLVDTDGKVEEANIASVEIYNTDKQKYESAQKIGYGLTSEILTAALQWKFRPAKNNGKPVKAYVKHAFNFGI